MVATPIGNLEDITLRAVRVLGEVDTIACEDTRHTLKLLNHLAIKKPLVACYAYDEERGSARILGLLGQGRSVAYCSDAGTPCLSDPGILVAMRARESGHEVVPIPGPSAFATLVSAAGIFYKSVTFDGFPSPKPGRRHTRVAELMARQEAFVMYESPHRIVRPLADRRDRQGDDQAPRGIPARNGIRGQGNARLKTGSEGRDRGTCVRRQKRVN